ncbi:MAG TPA: hypothetical protein VNU19_02390 [Candidatus Acidoferrum sp.]|nr:hypothetical protein [Candidatus Acidoferrum sp.]
MRELAAEGQAALAGQSVALLASRIVVEADMHYAGQRHSLRVPLAYPELTAEGIELAFGQVYFRRYGRRLSHGSPVLVNIHVVVLCERPRLDFGTLVLHGERSRAGEDPAVDSHRPVWFESVGFVDTEVYVRSDLAPGDRIVGPAIVEQEDTTTVVDPEMLAVTDGHGNLILRLNEGLS